MNDTNAVTLVVFFGLCGVLVALGFLAERWHRTRRSTDLNEWGLGGRSFGTFLTWFLMGGELYTAYVFIAVPALLFSQGGIGFYALPYVTLVFPFMFVIMPRLWSVARRHDYVTAADFVRGRYGSRGASLVVVVTGLLYTMPVIALQLLAIEIIFRQLGLAGASGWGAELPIVIAFVVLAIYTYRAGLRATALTAFLKDILIYVVVLAAIFYLPARVGGWDRVFSQADRALAAKPDGSLVPASAAALPYATLALGAALALFLSPFVVTAVLASSRRNVVQRNAALMPAYTLAMGFLALLGLVALAAGIQGAPNDALTTVFTREFPAWFVGVAFAAIATAALVPASALSVAAANLFSRNVYREYLRPEATGHQEARAAKIASLVIKGGALLFVILLENADAVQFSLLGALWLLQTFPMIVGGLYTRWFRPSALIAGWLVGMVVGTWMVVSRDWAIIYPIDLFGARLSMYPGIWGLLLNAAVAVVGTALVNRLSPSRPDDETHPEDYYYDVGDVDDHAGRGAAGEGVVERATPTAGVPDNTSPS